MHHERVTPGVVAWCYPAYTGVSARPDIREVNPPVTPDVQEGPAGERARAQKQEEDLGARRKRRRTHSK